MSLVKKNKRSLQYTQTQRNDVLKSFAMLTMIIDHIGYMFFPELMILRTIGRMAFPIFAYQLSIGFDKTSNLKKYILRLFSFGLLTQIPYSFFNPKLEFKPFRLNIMFTLMVALIFLVLLKNLKKEFSLFIHQRKMAALITSGIYFISLIFLIGVNEICALYFENGGLEYGWYGILLVLVFHYSKNNLKKLIFYYSLLSIVHSHYIGAIYLFTNNSIIDLAYSLTQFKTIWSHITPYLFPLSGYFFQARSIFSLYFISFLKRHSNKFHLNKWIGYIFYPAHISLLLIMKFFK